MLQNALQPRASVAEYLFVNHHAALVNRAKRLGCNPDTAEDIVSCLYQRLITKPREPITNPFAYALSAVRRAAYDQTTRKKNTVSLSGTDHPICDELSVPAVDAAWDADRLAQRVLQAAQTLPKIYRDTFTAVYLQGHTLADAAELIGSTEFRLKMRCVRLRRMLREDPAVAQLAAEYYS